MWVNPIRWSLRMRERFRQRSHSSATSPLGRSTAAALTVTPTALSQIGFALSALILGSQILWIEIDPASVSDYYREDHIFENLSAAFLGLGGFFLLLTAYRSHFLRGRRPIAYFFIVSLALLLFFLAGEEISWGQRIFDITVPDIFIAYSVQDETNLHNIWFIDGKIQASLIIFSLVLGVALPLIAMTPLGRRLMQTYCCPAPPLPYAILFIGAVVVGFVYMGYGSPLDPPDRAWEVREFLISCGVVLFALHGLLKRDLLFRCAPSDASTQSEKGDEALKPAAGD